MRGIAVLLLASASAAGAQEVQEERGRYRLSCFGREAGAEDFRLQVFDDGKTVLFSQVKFEVEIAGEKRGYLVDTVLTMDRAFSPVRYAGLHKAGAEERLTKLEFRKGLAVPDKGRARRSGAAHLLDNNVLSQLIPILRGPGPGRGKVRVYRPSPPGDADLVVEDRGEVLLSGPATSLAARELRLTLGYLEMRVHVAEIDGRRVLVRAFQVQTEVLAELEGYEGLVPVPPLPEGVAEEPVVVVASDGVPLAGTLTRPREEGRRTAVLILGAAGPQDREGNVVRGKGGLERFAWEGPDVHLYRELARAFGAAGCVVLRMDDRGCGRSGGEFETASYGRLLDDARAALEALRARPETGDVVLLGHGEGALLASQLASGGPLVLLAPPGRTLDAILLERADGLLREQGMSDDLRPKVLEKERALYARIRDAEGDWLDVEERRTYVGWMKERFRLDPTELLREAQASRVTLVHGSRDDVVPPSHARLLEEARPGIEVRRLEGLDHVLRRPGAPVDREALRAVVEAVLPN